MFRFGRRAIDLAVLFLAAYCFVFMPLGRRTGYEHLRAILKTRAARDAGRDVQTAAWRLGQKLMQTPTGSPATPRATPIVPALPRQANAAVTLMSLPAEDRCELR